MPLPDINLDDLRAQTLLDEARLRIARSCPEWTDYNVSDPGITLLELFAWKTEKLAYRLNRVPDKMLRRLIDLMGIDRLAPAVSAKTEITFRLVTPFPLADKGMKTYTDIPAGAQVATRRQNDEPEVVFTTRTPLLVGPLAISKVVFSGDSMNGESPLVAGGNRVAFDKPFALFGESPQQDEAFYIGFRALVDQQTPAGHVVRLTFSKKPNEARQGGREMAGSGYRPGNPPWVWEYWNGGEWLRLSMGNTVGEESDTTEGFNANKGALVLYLPADLKPMRPAWDVREAYWVRCRYVPDEATGNRMLASPRVNVIEAQVLGGAVEAENAVTVEGELLGISDGKPGQRFKLRHGPVLSLEHDASSPLDEAVEVENEGEHGAGTFERWTRVDDFMESSAHDKHYTLDEVSGEIVFGPAIRLRDSTVRQYGRVPALGRRIRITRYRYSLGASGNIKADKVVVLKTAIPLIDRVHNRKDARDGQDIESMELARMRARRAMRTQDRAVTAEDYENLLLSRFNARPDRGQRMLDCVARVKCLTHADMPSVPKGAVRVVILPGPYSPANNTRPALEAGRMLIQEVKAFLNPYRMVTTDMVVDKARFTEVNVRITLPDITDAKLRRDVLEARVESVARRLLAPAVLMDHEIAAKAQLLAGMPADEDLFGEGWAGWPFGQALEEGIVQAALMRLPEVRYVKAVDFFEMAPVEGEKASGERVAREACKTLALPADGLPLIQKCEVKFA